MLSKGYMQLNNFNSRTISFSEAINDALVTSMEIDCKMFVYGLGINDPKAIFGTTKGLLEKFGHKRVFDTPTSENAVTGVAIGAAIGGVRSVGTHQRLDFFLLAMDQLVNSAAKWNYTYRTPIPIVIRLIIGRGWGQGPTHSQNLQSWFSHIPGLKVLVPTNPYDAKGLLLSAIFDPNPVIFLEHRWMHNSMGDVPYGDYRIPIGIANKIKEGSDITIISMSYMTIEARRAVEYLDLNGVSCELIDMRSLSPIDWQTLFTSVNKTGRVLVLDTGHSTGSLAGEIIARITMECFSKLKIKPERMAMHDVPEPSSFGLTKDFYIGAGDIVSSVCRILDISDEKILSNAPNEHDPHDIPGEWFKGPF